MITIYLQKLAFYGCIGILIEFFFTGIYSLFIRNWKLTGHSYLWMFPVYALTALLLEAIKDTIAWPFYTKAFIYLIVIYGVEALSGYAIKLLTGLLQKYFGGHGGNTIPWEYPKSAWTLLGLVNFKYVPFWFVLCLFFEPISNFVSKVALYVSKEIF